MSSKTIAQKLLIRPDNRVWLSHPDRLELLGELPQGVAPTAALEEAEVALLFAEDAAALEELLSRYGEALGSRSEVTWFLYPKGNRTDINRDSLWPAVARHGLRPITQVAVDDTWSALRFRRLAEGEKQFGGGKKSN